MTRRLSKMSRSESKLYQMREQDKIRELEVENRKRSSIKDRQIRENVWCAWMLKILTTVK